MAKTKQTPKRDLLKEALTHLRAVLTPKNPGDTRNAKRAAVQFLEENGA